MALLVVIFLTVLGNVRPSCPLVTCRTSSSVQEGEPSRVACYFVHDLRKNKTDFRIVHYQQESHNKPDNVLECTYKGNRLHPACKAADGYQFDGEFGSQVTISIPSTTKGHEGTYVCESGHSDFKQSRDHSLQVNKAIAMATKCETSGPAELGKAASVNCIFPFNIDDTDVGIDHYEIMEDGSVSSLRRQIVHFNRTTYATGNGYKYVDSKNRSKLEIRIGHLEHHQLGVYVCRLLSTNPETKLQNCSLTLSESADASNSSKTVIIAASVMSIVELSLLLLQLVVKCVRYQRKKRNAEHRELPEAMKMVKITKSP